MGKYALKMFFFMDYLSELLFVFKALQFYDNSMLSGPRKTAEGIWLGFL